MKINSIGFNLFLSALLLLSALPGYADNQKSFLDTLSSPEPKMKTDTVEKPVTTPPAVSIVQKNLQIRDAAGQIKLLTIFVPTFVLTAVKETIARRPAPRSISSILAEKVRDLNLFKKLKETRNIPSPENIVPADAPTEAAIKKASETLVEKRR